MLALEVEKILAIDARQQQGERTDLSENFQKSEPIHAAMMVGTNATILSTENGTANEMLRYRNI